MTWSNRMADALIAEASKDRTGRVEFENDDPVPSDPREGATDHSNDDDSPSDPRSLAAEYGPQSARVRKRSNVVNNVRGTIYVSR